MAKVNHKTYVYRRVVDTIVGVFDGSGSVPGQTIGSLPLTYHWLKANK